jgi:hypothetical protein
LSLETIAPLWAARIKKGKLNPTRKFNLADPNRCIVGEAHGFTSPYYIRGETEHCKTCTIAGIKICDAASTVHTFINRKYEKTPAFDKQVKRFVTHFMKMHVSGR